MVALADRFKTDWLRRYEIVEVSNTVTERAMALAARYVLRGYDAVHVAAALELQEFYRVVQLPPITFVSADEEQLRAAQAEALPTENPNSHG